MTEPQLEQEVETTAPPLEQQETLHDPERGRELIATHEIPRPLEATLELLRRHRIEAPSEDGDDEPNVWPVSHYLIPGDGGAPRLYDAALTEYSQQGSLETLAYTEDDRIRALLVAELGLTESLRPDAHDVAASLTTYGIALEMEPDGALSPVNLLTLDNDRRTVRRTQLPPILLPDDEVADEHLELPEGQSSQTEIETLDVAAMPQPAPSSEVNEEHAAEGEDAEQETSKEYAYTLQLVRTETGFEFWMDGQPMGIDHADQRIQDAIASLLASGIAVTVDEEYGYRTTVEYRAIGDPSLLEVGGAIDVDVVSTSVLIKEELPTDDYEPLDLGDDDFMQQSAENPQTLYPEPTLFHEALAPIIPVPDTNPLPIASEPVWLSLFTDVGQAESIAPVGLSNERPYISAPAPSSIQKQIAIAPEQYPSAAVAESSATMPPQPSTTSERPVSATNEPDTVNVLRQHDAPKREAPQWQSVAVRVAEPAEYPVKVGGIAPAPKPSTDYPSTVQRESIERPDQPYQADTARTPLPVARRSPVPKEPETLPSLPLTRLVPEFRTTRQSESAQTRQETASRSIVTKGIERTSVVDNDTAHSDSQQTQKHAAQVERSTVAVNTVSTQTIHGKARIIAAERAVTMKERTQQAAKLNGQVAPATSRQAVAASIPAVATPANRVVRQRTNTARTVSQAALPAGQTDTVRSVVTSALAQLVDADHAQLHLSTGADAPILREQIRPLSQLTDEIARAASKLPSLRVRIGINRTAVSFRASADEPTDLARFAQHVLALPYRLAYTDRSGFMYRLGSAA